MLNADLLEWLEPPNENEEDGVGAPEEVDEDADDLVDVLLPVMAGLTVEPSDASGSTTPVESRAPSPDHVDQDDELTAEIDTRTWKQKRRAKQDRTRAPIRLHKDKQQKRNRNEQEGPYGYRVDRRLQDKYGTPEAIALPSDLLLVTRAARRAYVGCPIRKGTYASSEERICSVSVLIRDRYRIIPWDGRSVLRAKNHFPRQKLIDYDKQGVQRSSLMQKVESLQFSLALRGARIGPIALQRPQALCAMLLPACTLLGRMREVLPKPLLSVYLSVQVKR